METYRPREANSALEQIFVRQLENEQRRRAGSRHDREWLRAELELDAGDLLDRLIALGVTAETAPAFESLPLVEVAWADGDIDVEERWRVLRLATAFGLELGRPAHAQLELWLARRPEEALFGAWRSYASAVLSRPAASDRARRVSRGAREVAMAAGGVLGFGTISRSEKAVLDRIDDTLALRLSDVVPC